MTIESVRAAIEDECLDYSCALSRDGGLLVSDDGRGAVYTERWYADDLVTLTLQWRAMTPAGRALLETLVDDYPYAPFLYTYKETDTVYEMRVVKELESYLNPGGTTWSGTIVLQGHEYTP